MATDPRDPLKNKDIPSNLDQLLNWTILQHNLFNYSSSKPAASDYNLPIVDNPSFDGRGALKQVNQPQLSGTTPNYNWMGVGRDAPKAPLPYDPAATMQIDPMQAANFTAFTGTDPKPKNPFDWNKLAKGINTSLMAVDMLLPEQKIRTNEKLELNSYNPAPYGRGSQAIYKKGGKIKAEDGLTLLGGEDPITPQKRMSYEQIKKWNQFMGTQKNVKPGTLHTLYSQFVKQNPNPGIELNTLQSELDMLKQKAVQQATTINAFSGENTHTGYVFPDLYLNNLSLGPVDGELKTRKSPPVARPAGRINKTVPSYVKDLLWDESAQLPYYIDEKTGYMEYTEPGMLYSNRFKKPLPEKQMKYGGKMKSGKKCDDGATLPIYYEPGKSYDLDEQTIKQLLAQGYQLDFE